MPEYGGDGDANANGNSNGDGGASSWGAQEETPAGGEKSWGGDTGGAGGW
jgi:hypothetical protein